MDSMNRFCDDLIEDILCLMSFEDKIKYECVCRQWKRCLFAKQTVLVINGNEESDSNECSTSLNQLVVKITVDNVRNKINVLRKNSLECVLKKCPAIRKLVISGCECDNQVLQLIADYCPHLEDLEVELVRINPYENCILELGRKLGKNLKRFRFVYFAIALDIVKAFLNSCPKLESINCDILTAISDQRTDFLPKLNNLRVRVRPSDEEHFEILSQKYSKQNSLQSLTIYGKSESYPEVLRHISTITSLQSLSIDINSDTSADRLVNSLLLMANNLKDLKVLNINSMVFISGQFFQRLGHFKSLTKLSVNQNLLFTRSNANISISHLNGCKELKHLSINGFNFSEHFFDDISLYLPQLKSIEFSLMTDNVITDHLFRQFEGMDELQKFSFKLIVNKAKKLDKNTFESLMTALITITDDGLYNMVNTCPKLRIIELTNVFNPFVGQKTLNAIKIKANNYKKLDFILNISEDQITVGEDSSHQNIYQEQIPPNLFISLKSMANKSNSPSNASDYLIDFE